MAKKVTQRKKRGTKKQVNARAKFPVPEGRPKRKGVKQPPRYAKKRARAKPLAIPPPREVGVLDLIGEACGDVSSLAEEMRSWADNMEEKFSATQKYEEVNQAADTLEGLDEPSTEITALNDHKITWQDPRPSRRPLSRSTRAMQACDMLRAVEEKLREITNQTPEDEPEHDAAHGLADEVELYVSELEGVEFPGMF